MTPTPISNEEFERRFDAGEDVIQCPDMNSVRPYVVEKSLEDGYKTMANDKEREKEALEWCNALTINIQG